MERLGSMKHNKFRKEFYNRTTKDKCCYCQLSEKMIRDFITIKDRNGEDASRKKRRGLKFEIERLTPRGSYDDKNCRLSCYICNNAKSNFLVNPVIFANTVGKSINEIVQNTLKEGKHPDYINHIVITYNKITEI